MKRLAAILMLLVFCAVGCGRKTTTSTAPDGSKATVTPKADGSEVTVTGPKGETVRVATGKSNVALPEGFPKDVPIYSPANVTTSAKVQNTMSVVLATADEGAKVLGFYSEQLKAGGWQMGGTMNSDQGGMLSATKGESTCTIYVGHDEQTTVNISVAVAEK
jgi:hypothetical protein